MLSFKQRNPYGPYPPCGDPQLFRSRPSGGSQGDLKEEASLASVFEDAAHPVGDLHGHPVTKHGGAVETLGAGNADDRIVPGGRGLAPICREKKT